MRLISNENSFPLFLLTRIINSKIGVEYVLLLGADSCWMLICLAVQINVSVVKFNSVNLVLFKVDWSLEELSDSLWLLRWSYDSRLCKVMEFLISTWSLSLTYYRTLAHVWPRPQQYSGFCHVSHVLLRLSILFFFRRLFFSFFFVTFQVHAK